MKQQDDTLATVIALARRTANLDSGVTDSARLLAEKVLDLDMSMRLGCAWPESWMTRRIRTSNVGHNPNYVWIDMPEGTTLQLFYNVDTRLFVADVADDVRGLGNEFVRTTVPRL